MERRVLAYSRDPDFLDLYTTALNAEGLGVVGLESAAALPEMLPQHPFAVAVIDVLGERDWEPMSLILDCAIPAIVVTGWWSPERLFRERAFRAGAAAFVVKPVSPATLVHLVRRVLDGERGIDVLPTSG